MTLDHQTSPSAATDDAAWAFAPASVSNVACGFDVVGFALDVTEAEAESEPTSVAERPALGDWVCARRAEATGTCTQVVKIFGDDGVLPRGAADNTAAVAAEAVRRVLVERGVLDSDTSLELLIHKHMPISSGIGSSAASAAAAAAAVDALFGQQLSETELLACALDGEFVASRSRHADNVAPALLGGLLAVRALTPQPDLLRLPIPARLSCALVLPEIEVSTSAARAALAGTVPLPIAVQQSANLAALVHALHAEDFELLSRALVDLIAEPVRKSAVPGFDDAMVAARSAGGLGGSLSGSGPALFALCEESSNDSRAVALVVAEAMRAELERSGVASRALAARIAPRGARATAHRSQSHRDDIENPASPRSLAGPSHV